MKRKESLWELLKRLDEQAGQLNQHLRKANRYFDNSAMVTQKVLDKHEKELHKLVGKVREALRSFMQQKEKKAKRDNR